MPYTPELDQYSCAALRRLSWAVGEPMTKTMKEIFKFIPLFMDSGKVCTDCEDKSKCDECYFSEKNKEGLKNELFTEIVDKKALEDTFFKSRFTERTKPKKKKKLKLCKSCQKKVASQQKRLDTQDSQGHRDLTKEDFNYE